MGCRCSVVFVGLSAFVSLYVRERTGAGETAGTAALCGRCGAVRCGGDAGREPAGRAAGAAHVVRRSYGVTLLAVAGVLLMPGGPLYLFVALASAGLYVPFSLHVTLGQGCPPRRVGTASAVTPGLTVSVGGAAAAPAIGLLTLLLPPGGAVCASPRRSRGPGQAVTGGCSGSSSTA
ncbi:hypothetical protein ACWCPF_33595 [Streptomyces sp. NPDC001858]